MNKNQKIMSVMIVALLVAVIPILISSYGAATAFYGPYEDFNVIVKQDYQIDNSTIEGRVAAGNQLTSSSDSIIGKQLSAGSNPSLVVGNAIQLESKLEVTNGSVISKLINDQSLLSTGTEFQVGTESNLKDSFTYFEQQGDRLVAELMARKVDLADPATNQELAGYYDTNDKSLIISDLAATSLPVTDERYVNSEVASSDDEEIPSEQTVIKIDQLPLAPLQSHEYLIFRSDATYVDFNNTVIQYDGEELGLSATGDEAKSNLIRELAEKIVWVFPNAEQVNLNDANLIGTILAPNATVKQDSGVIVGQLYINNFVQAGGYIANINSFINSYDFNRSYPSSTITVEFNDQDGYDIHQPIVFTREVGTLFRTKLPVIEGYNVTTTEKYDLITIGSEVPEQDETIILEYRSAFTSKLTTYHQLSDGTDIVEPDVQYLDLGDAYTTQPLGDEGYQLLTTPVNSIGTASSPIIEVVYVYAPVGATNTITIRHVDSAGEDLIPSTSMQYPTGEKYDVSNDFIVNNRYQYVGLYPGSSAATGNLDSNITIIFEYAVNNICPQLETQPSDSTGDNRLNLQNVNRATEQETQYNEVVANRLIEGYSTPINDSTVYDFGNQYTSDSTNSSFIDFRYSFNGNKSYAQFIPVRQTGEFEPINIVVSNDGNGYDIRSRNSASDLAKYQNEGLGYQKLIGSQGYKSLTIRFEECQVVVGYNNGITTSNTSETTNFTYTDLPSLDETVAGYTTEWDPETQKLVVKIIFEKNKALYYSGNSFEIDLTGKQFLPQDYALVYNNTSETSTKVYRPYTNSTRYMYEVVALKSPYVDLTTTQHKADTAVGFNQIYEVSLLNGKVNYRQKLASSTNIVEAEVPYDPDQKYTAMITSGSMGRRDVGVYSYIAGNSYSPTPGFTQTAETQVIYARGIHPVYSMTATIDPIVIPTDTYTSLGTIVDLKYAITSAKNGEQETESTLAKSAKHYFIDESSIDFTTKGDYSALGYIKSFDPLTGEYITSDVSPAVSVTGVNLDFGDAPESYGPAGALIGNTRNRYNIGINRNGSRSTHADAESEPQYSQDARGDDTTGISDETGWFNMDPNGVGELNVFMEKLKISFPYTASGNNAAIAFWLDYNQNGVFEDFEMELKSVNSSDYDEYGMVTFTIDLSQEFSTLAAGDTTYARVRILDSKSVLAKGTAEQTYANNYGETEDFVVNLYGKKNEYQICTQVLANTPMATVKSSKKISYNGPYGMESGVEYTLDIGEPNPNSNSTNSFYPDTKIAVTSLEGITELTATGNGVPTYFKVGTGAVGEESPANVIRIRTFNKDGEPINLPLTFAIWGLNEYTGDSLIESVSIDKNSIYMEGFEAEDVKLTEDSVGVVEDYDTYLKLFTNQAAASEPSSVFYLQGSSLAKSEIEIVEEAREIEIGFGLDLGQMDKVIADCVEPYGPQAQIQVFDQFYDDQVSLYASYPFKYQSTNIPFPYFENFNSVTQNLYIPEGVEFVSGNTDVTIYRRDLLGSRTEADWELVDEQLYTQKLDLENNISSVKFDDPVKNGVYGYEYRMEYNFEIDENMQTGQRIVFKSDFEYNKGKKGESTEVYKLNDVTAIVREAFTADFNTIMGDETIYVESTSNSIYYTYQYLNCLTCAGVSEPTRLSEDITIPIADPVELDFYSDADFDRYEDIKFSLYDNQMKVFEFPIRRWYPTEMEIAIDDNTYDQTLTEGLNPVSQTIQVRPAYKLHSGFEQPIKSLYSQEVIGIKHDPTVNQLENAVLELDDIEASISTVPQSQIPASWGEGLGTELDGKPFIIEVDDLAPVFDPSIVYLVADQEICSEAEEAGTECLPQGYHAINIEAEALDQTLETAKVTKDQKEYKTILFKDRYAMNDDGSVNLKSQLDSRYVIENYSGRIYNKAINRECKLDSQVAADYPELNCDEDQVQNYHIPTAVIDNILSGYNDLADSDKIIADSINGIPLATDLKTGDRFEYFVFLPEVGRNKTEITIADNLVIETTPLAYYGDEGTFYFKRTTPTNEEVKCIKEEECETSYQSLVSGTVNNTYDIKHQIEDNTDYLDSYKTANNWLEFYR